MRRPSPPDEDTEVEFRVVEFRVKGGSAAVIDSLRGIAGTISARPTKAVPQKVINAPASLEKEQESPQEELDFGDDAAPEAVLMAEGSTRTPRTRKPVAAPEILTGLDIKNGTPTFADFFASLGQPDGDRKRYLAIAYWLKRHYATPITAITPQHPFTVYRLMNWPVPMNAFVPLRDAADKGDWFTKDDKGYVISNVGEAAIDKLLAKKK